MEREIVFHAQFTLMTETDRRNVPACMQVIYLLFDMTALW